MISPYMFTQIGVVHETSLMFSLLQFCIFLFFYYLLVESLLFPPQFLACPVCNVDLSIYVYVQVGFVHERFPTLNAFIIVILCFVFLLCDISESTLILLFTPSG